MRKIAILLVIIISNFAFSNNPNSKVNTKNIENTQKSEITGQIVEDKISYKSNNVGKAYGYLRKTTSDNVQDKIFSNNDILILDKLEDFKFPYTVSALIIGSDERTTYELNNIDIPMMTYKDAYISKDLSRLVGKFVCIEIGKDSFVIRKSTKKEAREYYESIK